MAGTNRDAYYVQPGSNCGFGANSQGQELTAHAGKRTGRKLMKRTKKDFLNGFLNIWYPIPSLNCFVARGEKGEVTTDFPVKIVSYSIDIKQGS